jgi:hypothetical protein
MLLAMFLMAPVLLDDHDRSSSHGPASIDHYVELFHQAM